MVNGKCTCCAFHGFAAGSIFLSFLSVKCDFPTGFNVESRLWSKSNASTHFFQLYRWGSIFINSQQANRKRSVSLQQNMWRNWFVCHKLIFPGRISYFCFMHCAKDTNVILKYFIKYSRLTSLLIYRGYILGCREQTYGAAPAFFSLLISASTLKMLSLKISSSKLSCVAFLTFQPCPGPLNPVRFDLPL